MILTALKSITASNPQPRCKPLSNNIFSTYSQGENRVTSTIIQVLKNLPINVVERFLSMFAETDAQNFFSFTNQVKGKKSVPDAEISSNFKLLFETKITSNAVNEDQLKAHLKLCQEKKDQLVYLTPDAEKPELLKDENVVWKSFSDVYELINELLTDTDLILSERDQFLLRNLQLLFEDSKLLPVIENCVVVAARIAWPAYEKHGVYVCQAGRTFRKVDWLAFYCGGEIQPKVAKIHYSKDVKFPDKNGDTDTNLSDQVKRWLKDNEHAYGQTLKVFKLSRPEDNETVDLEKTIPNDLKNESGRGYAFTQGQRYTSLDALKNAETTKDLVKEN